MGAKTSKTLVIEDKNTHEFSGLTEEMRNASVRAAGLNALYIPLVMLASSAATAIVLARGGNLVLEHGILIGTLSAFTTYAVSIFEPIQQMARVLANIIAVQPNIERVMGLLDQKPNIVDTPEVIEKYGADALRYTLITGNAPGNDMRFYWERVEASRNFANKVWNASRFIMMNDPDNKIKTTDEQPDNLTAADKWILSKMNHLIAEVTENMEKYELGIAVAKLNDFIWEEFCDWYIEMVKPRLYNDEDTTKNAAIWTLKTVLIDALKLLHPYMPFITEEIFCNIQDDEESIMISSWPVYDEKFNFPDEEVAIQTIKEAVRNIRNVRAQMNVAPSRKAKVYVVSEDALIRDIFENGRVFFATLAYASEVAVQSDKSGIPDDAVSAVIPGAVLYIPFAELVDIDKEIERLKKEEGRLNGEIKRCEGMLGNEKFISKAPQAKIDEEKAKLEKYQQMLAQVRERLQALTK